MGRTHKGHIRQLSVISVFSGLVLLGGCGGGGDDSNDGGIESFFPAQTFSEDFDSGAAGSRWGCGSLGCNWQVVRGGPLDPFKAAPAAVVAAAPNFVFQSPDPLAMNLNRGFSCVGFPARFEQQGTFAFNYFVKTAGSLGLDDGNALEVDVISHTVEFDPDFGEEIIVDSQRTNVLRESGEVSSRFHTLLPAGYYDFEFCYVRDRTFNIGPDFVQIDNVDTCMGTDCIGEVPAVARCHGEQGETLVPDSRDPRGVITVSEVQDADDRYSVIVDTGVLQFIDSSLESLDPDPVWDSFRNELGAVVALIDGNGERCDIDDRKHVRVVFTEEQLIDFLLESDAVWDAIDQIVEAINQHIINPALLELYKTAFGELWGTALFAWREEINGALDDIGL